MPTPDTKLLQGTLDMLILKALSLGPLHGYGVGQRIMQCPKTRCVWKRDRSTRRSTGSSGRGEAPLNGACRRIISAPNSTS
jgi:hypothetical protein